MRVYIAGPMTGRPAYNVEAFQAAAYLWGLDGHDVVTPFECNSVVWRRHHGRDFDPHTDRCEWGDPVLREMFAEDVKALASAETVAFLAGWEQSKGARMEHALATTLGIPCVDAVRRQPLAPAPESVCQEADRLVSGDRGAAYGHPFDDYTKTGTIWGAILHGWAKEAAASPVPVAVPPDLAILCMIGVKLSREVHASKRDNRVDTCGYAKCLDMVREHQGRA